MGEGVKHRLNIVNSKNCQNVNQGLSNTEDNYGWFWDDPYWTPNMYVVTVDILLK